uniref:RRM domain-containing protein n=1 Tax=Trichobilharzia regenti TaxID=157069 RepID=A0AA85IX90_TRIRE|nr:unnamed protein product [Trichobilharzia regenti]
MGSDTSEGKTLFIRNLSFDVEEDVLFDFFTKFGHLEFAKIVKDPATQHSRGSAFVKFLSAEDASSVLQQSARPECAHQFVLDNRTLNISIAVSRTEAENLRKRSTIDNELDSPEDTKTSVCALKHKGRNLHLASIGIIRPGTIEAKDLSKEDLAKRDELLREKKKKLTDPNYFISDIRLCIRNLPLNIDDNDLKATCYKYVKEKTCRISECRVMRNLQPGRQQYRSLGYAFVTFDNHENALRVLNGLNNNPNAFPSSNRRPIVEFSVENMRALQLKEKRAQKSSVVHSKTKDTTSTLSQPSTLANIINNPEVYQKYKKNLKKKTPLMKKKNSSQKLGLPKHFGAKKRHRNRGLSSTGSGNNKPKQKKSRKQKRMQKSTM